MRSRSLKFYLLTEATARTGLGHLGRCIALSDAFSDRGVEPCFIVNGEESARDLLAGKNACFFDWIADSHRLSSDLAEADILLVDSYHAPESLYCRLAGLVPLGLWIDDYGRISYPPGIVVNGTVGAEKMNYPHVAGTTYLLGADYVLLRREFWEVPPKTIRPEVEKILLSFGGSDVLGLTGPVLSRLDEHYPDLEKHVVLGAASCQRIVSDPLRKITVHSTLSAGQMRALMGECDLALSAAGQTLNELARCGTPSLAFQVADNQRENIEGWIREGFIPGASTLATLVVDLERLLPQEARLRVSERGSSRLDGQGARRIAARTLREYFFKRLTLRPLRPDDLMPLFELANDPLVRRNSFSTDPIPLDEHRAWFSRLLRDDSVLMVIFEIEGELVGQVRFDRKPSETVTSLSVSADFRGYGLGAEMLRRAISKVRGREGFPLLTAYIKPENTASQKSFRQAGYLPKGEGKWCYAEC